MAGADVTGIDPAFNRTGITFDGLRRHAFCGCNGLLFTHPHADAAIRAPVVVDHGFLFDQLDGVHRTIPHAKPAADAFLSVYFHFQKFIGVE
jgi:hypothetical protein